MAPSINNDLTRSRVLLDIPMMVEVEWPDGPKLRTAIGTAAKSAGWFKDTTRGDLWFKVVGGAFNDPVFGRTNLAVELRKLWEWAERV